MHTLPIRPRRALRILLSALLLALPAGLWAQSAESDALFARGLKCFQKADYARAIDCFEQVAALDAAELPEQSIRAAYANVWLAHCYYRMGDEETAIALSPTDYMLVPVDRSLTRESDRLFDLANEAYESGDTETAIALYRQAGEHEREALGDGHYYYANTLLAIADVCGQIGDTDGMVDALEEALPIYRRYAYAYGLGNTYSLMGSLLREMDGSEPAYGYYVMAYQHFIGGGYRTDCISTLLYMASCKNDLDDPVKALEHLEEARTLADEDPTIVEGDYVYALIGSIQAFAHYRGLDYQQAYQAASRAQAIFEAQSDLQTDVDYVLNEMTRAYSASYFGLEGYDRIVKQVYEELQDVEAIKGTILEANIRRLYLLCNPDHISIERRLRMQQRLLADIEEMQGGRTGDYLEVMADMLIVYGEDNNSNYTLSHLSDYKQLCRDTKQLADRTTDYFSPEKAQVYKTIAEAEYALEGDVERSIATYRQIIGMLEADGWDNIPVYGQLLVGLATVCMNSDHYYDAFEANSRAISLYQRLQQTQRPEYAEALRSIAYYYNNVGDQVRSVAYHNMAMKADEEAGRGEANVLAHCSYLWMTGQIDELEDVLSATLSKPETQSGAAAPNYAMLHIIHAILCGQRGDWSEVKRELRWTKQTVGEAWQANPMSYVIDMLQAVIEYGTNDIESAARTLQAAATQAEQASSTNTSALTQIYGALINLYSELGRWDDVATAAQRVAGAVRRVVSTTFRSMTYDERSRFWSQYAFFFDNQLPIMAYRLRRPNVDAMLYDATLLSKGLLLSAEVEVKRLIAEANDPYANELYTRLQALNSQLRRLKADDDAHARLSAELEEVERTLVNEVKAYGDYMTGLNTTWTDVQARLEAADAAVEFVAAPISEDSIVYSALVLRSDCAPMRIDLCSEADIKAIASRRLYTTPQLSRLIWEPLREALDGVQRIYFAPQQMLHSLAIEYVPIDDEGHRIVDRYPELYRLSSTRLLAQPTRNDTHAHSAVLYGGLTYDAPSATDAAPSMVTTSPSSTTTPSRPRAVADDLRGAMQGVEELPYTLQEVRDIATLYHDRAAGDCLTRTGAEGTEETFKQLTGTDHTVLHLATHGFYHTGTQLERSTTLQQLMAMVSQSATSTEDRALTRSGLYLSGVNDALMQRSLPAEREDGILTAAEIATLDLHSLDLVVLSACQSALGELSGDGVFGLQRGFKKAGAGTLLMSLWRVDDLATRLLMTAFYKHWLGDGTTPGVSKREALARAQAELRQAEGGRYDLPRLWAAFVLLDAMD